MSRLVLPSILLLALAGCEPERIAPPAKPPEQLKIPPADLQSVAPKAAALIALADRAHLYRIAMPFTAETTRYADRPKILGEYSVIADRDLSPPEKQRVTELLLDPATFDKTHAMACLFEPAYVVQFRAQNDVVDVVICFHCRDVEIRGVATTVLAEGENTRKLYELLTGAIPL